MNEFNGLLENGKFEEFYNVIHKIAKEYSIEKVGNDIMIYPCGFAWTVFKKESEIHPFVQWLINEKKDGIYKCPIKKMYKQYVHGPYNQSHDHKYYHAHMYTTVLNKFGITCYSESRLD